MARNGGTPTTLADGQSGVFGIAIDAANVYWTDTTAGTVMKVSLDGGTPVPLASGQNDPLHLAVDATSVYWANGGGGTNAGAIMSVPIAGGSPTPLASGQMPYGIAVDGTSVYWTNRGSSAGVFKVPLGGGTPVPLTPSGLTTGWAIAVDAVNAYWASEEVVGSTSVGSILQVPLTGGTPKAVAASQPAPRGIALYGGVVYWANQGGGGMISKLTPGRPGWMVLATDSGSVRVAVDATSVYWADAVNHAVMKLTPK